jgi:DNA-binding PadR family transcriptional regulator
MGIRQKLIGILAIFVIPAVYIGEIVFSILSGTYSLVLVLMLTVVIALYLVWLFETNPYGPEQIREVRIPGADKKTVELLKMTTRRGDLINVRLLHVFKDDESHTRSAVKETLEDRGIRLSQPTVDGYVKKLEQCGLISSLSTEPYDKPYRITDEGQHHLWLVQTYFPKRRLFFLWRHYVGIRGKVKKTQPEKAE